MSVLADHQLTLIALAFFLGLAGTVALFLRHVPPRVWQFADLGWVVLGGFGAVAAVIAGIYKADSTRLSRQIDVAYAAARTVAHDADRFTRLWCAAPGPDMAALCARVGDIAAATAASSGLPLFIDVARITAPLQDLALFLPRAEPDADDAALMDTMSHDAMTGMVETFSPDPYLALASDPVADAAAEALARDPTTAAAVDYSVIAASYTGLVGQVAALKGEWDYLQAHRLFLAIQIIAICLVAFAAPFRLGKSLVDLGAGRD
jgi:hypothetical protein